MIVRIAVFAASVLSAIAELLTTFRRNERDCAARYGGEEFALLMPGMTAKDAVLLAERIRRRVAALAVRSRIGAAVAQESARVTISIGVTTACGPAIGDCRRLVDAADAALYRAKHAGGNRAKYEPLPAIT